MYLRGGLEIENFCEMFNRKMMKLSIKSHLRESFYRLKPLCDSVMVKPTAEHIAEFMAMVPTVKQENLQELQQYILFPFITHIKSAENEGKYDVLIQIIDAMTSVLQHIKVTTFDVTMKTERGLLSLVFDRAKTGMLADVPEELKLSVMKCLTALMLGVTVDVKVQILKTQVPVLAQAVFVSVHIAKLDRMRALRLASIECLNAHTMSHPEYTDENMHLKYPELDEPTADFLASILPGVLAALQDVAMCKNNPGHAVVVAALEATHRILCIAMHNKRLKKKPDISVQDFTFMIAKSNVARLDKDWRDKSCKELPMRSAEWYLLAGDKLQVVTRSLAPLATHEHHLVRREFAVLCARIIDECCDTLPSSVPLALDVLISMFTDDYKEVSEFCTGVVRSFFDKSSPDKKMAAMDGLCENFFTTLINLPRIFNHFDSSRQLSALNLVRGYIEVLRHEERPQRLTAARCDALCDALLAAAALQPELTLLTRPPGRDISITPVSYCPWLHLRHLDSKECQKALEGIIQLLGGCECAELLLDRLLELFHQRRDCELVYIMNLLGSAPDAPSSLAKRIINTYIEEDIWNLPLDIGTSEKPLTKAETLDPDVYNPRAWVKDSVPGLYEGATAVRYTDISYQCARVLTQPASDTCRTAAQWQRNLAMSCLLTEGVGVLARRLRDQYRPFLLRTLCLVLERVGSKYEILHKSGTKALTDIAEACGLRGPADLIARNADYFTSQISARLKKAWDVQSALQILTVVMTYSDTSILEYLYAIVEDVLVQSCDKYHQKNLFAYLQVFECFVYCIHQWFPIAADKKKKWTNNPKDYLKDFTEYVKNKEEVDRLLDAEELDMSGKSAEELYREDLKKREQEALECDETVTPEPPPLPKHVAVTKTILKRSINFIATKERDEGILAMHILLLGFPILQDYENELLPLVHQAWAPLVTKFVPQEPLVMKKAFELLVVIGDLCKDFIRSRAVKDVFPQLFQFLRSPGAAAGARDPRAAPAHALQLHALAHLPYLARDLGLDDRSLLPALAAVDRYLSRRQPRQLQELAVKFFKIMLKYNHGATWLHLRELCNNNEVLEPPTDKHVALQTLVGTPYSATNPDYDANIRLIFNLPPIEEPQ
ncbi:TELO2-interacting protein 1 homolog [Epargyreus clarus]|uniref:TELO2-interacting protein 1 homolog n=1 Tax=Epargyreus clarus TaxID=520877 RepID=UPI003C2FD39C